MIDMLSSNNDMKRVYKLGKSIKGNGLWMVLGILICPLILFALYIYNFYSSTFLNSPISPILIFGVFFADVAFLILLIIYRIMMIIRGFNAAKATGIKEYMQFSLFYLISIIIIIIMSGILISGMINNFNSVIDTYNNSNAIQDPALLILGLLGVIVNYFTHASFIVILPTIGLSIGYIIQIISWFFFKRGINHTLDYGKVRKSSSRSIFMIVSLTVLLIFNIILFLLTYYNLDGKILLSFPSYFNFYEILLIFFIPYVIFYILEIYAYVSIGNQMKTGYNKPNKNKLQKMKEPTITSDSNQSSQ